MELPDPPEGWKLKSLIEQDGVWKAYIYSPREWCCGAGSSPRYALLDTIQRITDGATYPVLSGMTLKSAMLTTADVLAALKIPQKPIDRRF